MRNLDQSISSTPSVVSGLSDSVSTYSTQGEIEIPSHWRPEVEECLAEKSLSDSARPEMVRTLVNDAVQSLLKKFTPTSRR